MKRLLSVAVVFLTSLFVFGQGDLKSPAGVPVYNPGPPKKGAFIPPILPKDALWGVNFQHRYQSRAYELASKISDVIYQQPCYCYCDRIGHNSLRSCFESTHAANCPACLKEVYYSYQQTKAGKTPAQIRQGIIRGEWKQIDLEKAASIQ
ncbi:MAG TPA: PCYCGC motif-containing (lipo)protein [Terriglobales bacterium]|nr:PCYCGC motif-containing (lipo)protein [Terriglobales bacterium]